jgi:hypothetical protein
MYSDVRHIVVEMFPDGRMDAKNASRYLGCSTKTLAHLRCSGTGPSFIKPGRIFYYKTDLDSWLNQRGRLISTAQLTQSKERHEGQVPCLL